MKSRPGPWLTAPHGPLNSLISPCHFEPLLLGGSHTGPSGPVTPLPTVRPLCFVIPFGWNFPFSKFSRGRLLLSTHSTCHWHAPSSRRPSPTPQSKQDTISSSWSALLRAAECVAQEHRLQSQCLDSGSSSVLSYHVTLGKLLRFSVPWFPHT